jgi:hypothetical protein
MRGARREEQAQRWRCWILAHKYVRIRYPDSPDGYFLRCVRCSRERDESGGSGYAGGMNVGY